MSKLFYIALVLQLSIASIAFGARGDQERKYFSNALNSYLKKEFPNDDVTIFYNSRKDILHISLDGPSFKLSEYWKVADLMIKKLPMVAYLCGLKKATSFYHLESKLGFENIFLSTPEATYELLGWYKRNYR